MFNFDFFGSSFESESEDLLLEKLEIKHESMTEMRFKRFFTKIILGAKLSGDKTYSALGTPNLDLSVKSLTVPKKPKREKNPLTKETLQSYTVKVELSDGQKIQMLVQFEGEGALKSKTIGMMSEIKLNGSVLPLTTKDAQNTDLRAAIKKIQSSLKANTAKFQARQEKKKAAEAAKADKKDSAVDTTGNRKNDKIGHDAEMEKKRKLFNDKTGGGLEGTEFGKQRRVSKQKQLKELQARQEERTGELETFRSEYQSMEQSLAQQEERIIELRGQVESAKETLANLANAGAN